MMRHQHPTYHWEPWEHRLDCQIFFRSGQPSIFTKSEMGLEHRSINVCRTLANRPTEQAVNDMSSAIVSDSSAHTWLLILSKNVTTKSELSRFPKNEIDCVRIWRIRREWCFSIESNCLIYGLCFNGCPHFTITLHSNLTNHKPTISLEMFLFHFEVVVLLFFR